jgi:hypothetical protein
LPVQLRGGLVPGSEALVHYLDPLADPEAALMKKIITIIHYH